MFLHLRPGSQRGGVAEGFFYRRAVLASVAWRW
jgi:hypothetical protein